MDDDMIKDSLEGFDAVWQRVTCRDETAAAPQIAAPAFSEEETLRGFIVDETCAQVYAAGLARAFQGEGRTILQRLAGDAKRRARRLRAEYFIRTGAMPPSGGDCPDTMGRLASLRAMLLQAEDMTARYTQAAERTAGPELHELYQIYAAEQRRRAQEVRALLIESF